MKKLLFTLALCAVTLFVSAQEPLSYYLPDDVSYNPEIPTPEEYFHMQVGEWHLTYDQIYAYANEIARVSDRAIVYEYARTYENRPIINVVFTTPENQSNLKELKEKHYRFSEPGSDVNMAEVPLVVSLTYSVHGNESSGGNASVLTMYYLAAAQGNKIDELLNSTIVLVDPVINPDGFTRHSTWANMHQSYVANGDGNSRQFDEVWPGGRTNHYWFDLNRDYLLLVHPESQGRVANFHAWKPNIVNDHHEMGYNSTFFFQPGVPTRNNPLTPESNYQLTKKIAAYHAKYLDKIGASYYSEEEYDDYYFGKGSSYPDINGSIGILYEQAGFRGRIRETINGPRKLSYGIRNHFVSSLSTLDAAVNLHNDLLEMQKDFFNDALYLADQSDIKAYIFGSKNDKVKTQMFIDFLNRHQINVYQNEDEFYTNGQTFEAKTSYVVPVKQKQYRLIRSIFDEVSSFADTTFYDISTWTFTHAYDMKNASLGSLKNLNMSAEPVMAVAVTGKVIGDKNPVAYVFKWNEYSAAEALYSVQNAGLITKVATRDLTSVVDGLSEHFGYGTILIPAHNQVRSPEEIHQLVEKVAQKTGIDFYALSTGLTPEGIDLGSGSFEHLNKPEIALFVDGGADSRDAGEIWHLFDQRYHIPVTLIPTQNLRRADLHRYNSIILAGSFREWGDGEIAKLRSWANEGGNLIVYKRGAQWAAQNKLGSVTFKDEVKADTSIYQTYAEREKERSLNYIGGAIFETQIDITHPLCYGYSSDKLAIFKSSTMVANSLNQKYIEPVKFTASPYLSGWVSETNLERMKNAPVVSVQSIGQGKLISFYDNMVFRGTWLGTSKLFSNAVFFGSIIQ